LTSRAEHLAPIGEAEQRYAERRVLAPDRRLSCQARIEGPLVIDVPPEAAANTQVVRKRAENRDIVCDPAVRLVTVTLPPATMDDPRGAFDSVAEQVRVTHQIDIAQADLHVLEALTAALHKGARTVTLAVHKDAHAHTAIAVWPGVHTRCLGVACDIGSTTIACHLVDLVTGRTLASAGTANPQIRFGEDLMSRVSYVMLNAGGAQQLTESVRHAVAALAQRVVAQIGAATDDILDAVVVGNPVMHHMFLGLDPTALGQAPFELTVSTAVSVRARDVGLALNTGARTYLLPCIAGHVGADAAAVALAELPAQASNEAQLIVDVGTNAEIILAQGGRVFAASSPTGPAFEGAQISAGQRAAPGAIERVRIDPTTLEPRIRIIGSDLWSDDPGFEADARSLGITGICGSGIIEALGEMYLAGIVSRDGVIDGTLARRSPRIVASGRTFSYRLWPGAPDIQITQGDVRAIQLAKGALYAGVRLLMEQSDVDRIDRIKLAGAFGTHIDPLYAVLIGLVPDCAIERVTAVGNAAGTGARMALLNIGDRRKVEALARRIMKVETALEPRFQHHFVNAMAFPNAVDACPELGKVVTLPVPPPMTSGRRNRRRGD
jgi:uncharacterized 2Fe-2S/4Fe-4S cluster protein (DUF4445 family)